MPESDHSDENIKMDDSSSGPLPDDTNECIRQLLNIDTESEEVDDQQDLTEEEHNAEMVRSTQNGKKGRCQQRSIGIVGRQRRSLSASVTGS